MKNIGLPVGVARAWARLPLMAGAALAAFVLTASSASALSAHGQLLRVGPRLRSNTNTSGNWFGYNQGTLEQGGKLFNSIGGQWTVPTATQHTSGQAEDSADWIGIGGGCVDSGCTATDSTLIQTGTEQDVSATGHTSYDAWYELVPAPELQITSMTIHPGDRMSASLAEVVGDSNVWNVTIKDLTTGQSYSTTVPYSSSHATAEWIEETPLEIGDERRLRRASEPLESGLRVGDDQRAAGRPQDLGGARPGRLQRKRDRRPLGPELHGRRVRRLHLGDELQLSRAQRSN